MRAAKYHGTPTSSSGDPLSWPGTADGFPFKGRPPSLMKRHEYEQIPIAVDVRVEALDLPTDNDRYMEILDRCANQLWLLREKIGPTWDPEAKCYRVLLTWWEPYGIPPPPKNPYEADLDDYLARGR